MMIEDLKESHLNKEKAEVTLRKLEKLKEEISEIEARYEVLKADYADICQSAIVKISVLKDGLESEVESGEEKVSVEVERSGADTADILKPTISNREARIKLGIYLDNAPRNREYSPAIAFNKPNKAQFAVDKVADGIEFGLDKIGDAIIFIGECIMKLFTVPFKLITRKLRSDS